MLTPNPENKPEAKQPVETDYEIHQQNPGPSEEAVVEEDKNGASKVLRWILPALIILLLIIWLFF